MFDARDKGLALSGVGLELCDMEAPQAWYVDVPLLEHIDGNEHEHAVDQVLGTLPGGWALDR